MVQWKCANHHNFVQFWCILLNFAFAFDAFESSPWNFGLIRTGSKFQNFRLGDGESWKNHYRIYLIMTLNTSCLESHMLSVIIKQIMLASTVVEHSANHPKVKGLSLNPVAGTGRDKMRRKCWLYWELLDWVS